MPPAAAVIRLLAENESSSCEWGKLEKRRGELERNQNGVPRAPQHRAQAQAVEDAWATGRGNRCRSMGDGQHAECRGTSVGDPFKFYPVKAFKKLVGELCVFWGGEDFSIWVSIHEPSNI